MSVAIESFNSIFNILIVVTVITLLSRRFNFPQTLALIIAGIYSSTFTNFQLPYLESEIFIILLLPPILFQETLHLNVDSLLDDADIILSYSILGTMAMVISISLFSYFALNFGFLESIIMGIIIAPTDPVSVISTFQKLGVLKRFQLLVAGESLFNDGIAIVMYSIIITIITVGSMSIFDISIFTIITIFGGVLIGAQSGYLTHTIFCLSDDKFVKVLFSFIVAFGGFRLAEEFGSSGVLATVFSGLIINYRSKRYGGLTDLSSEMLDAIWEFIGFIAQSFAFIFIGMNMDTTILVSYAVPVITLFLFILLALYGMVVLVAKFIYKTRKKWIPDFWIKGITWSGLKGGVSIVLALGISSLGLPHGEEILALTFGVVLVSIMVQGIFMTPIIKKLNLLRGSHSASVFTRARVSNSGNKYNPEKYENGLPLTERIIFSFPEYIIYETRFGGWFSNQLLKVLNWMNRIMIDRKPKTTETYSRKIMKTITIISTKILNWITYFREKNR